MHKLIFILVVVYACGQGASPATGLSQISVPVASEPFPIVNPLGNTVATRFAAPSGYIREEVSQGDFAAFLRSFSLKPADSQVFLFDGRLKSRQDVQAAVLDIDTGTRDLQQCADAVMRLRAEWLYSEKRYGEIHFNYLSDNRPRYFRDAADATYSRASFRRYMNQIFAFANTASLKRELKQVTDYAIQPGDVWIQSGNPYGHAVIVMDVAIDTLSGKRCFLLAQSYMPAQDIHILINPEDKDISPWYVMPESALRTPEWTFQREDLHRFP